MKKSLLLALAACLAFAGSAHAQLRSDGATASFKGSLPPKPTADLSTEQQAALEKELADVTAAFQAVKKHPRAADAEIFLKAVRYALEFHEWYDKKAEDGVKKAHEQLAEASKRIEALKQNKTPWMSGPGQKVLGFYSQIDGSPQPYGVEVPEGLKWGTGNKPVPMWIWLHGRGDTATDIHFIASHLKAKRGQFQPTNAIVVHPFGRFCNGWKSAGETDVFECEGDAELRFNVDVNRIALAGFSMGGAGAWHLGAHYASDWAVVHTGAGFADVKRYTKLTPDKYPVWYEQKLWGMYDVPDYARNFYNVPLISYSGEIDAQRDSAEYMMEVLGKEGLHPPYLIGPGMPHKYHPDTLKELQGMIEKEVATGRNPVPKKVVLQFKAARYSHMAWVQCLQVQKQWEDTRIEAELVGDRGLRISTKNVTAFRINRDMVKLDERNVTIDGQKLGVNVTVHPPNPVEFFVFFNGKWTVESYDDYFKSNYTTLTKAGGVSIEDAFVRHFVVVLPDGPGRSPQVDAWVKAESSHFLERWRKLMRGDVVVMPASKVDFSKDADTNLILWGDDKSNSAIAACLSRLPVKWEGDSVAVGPNKFAAKDHVPVLVYPRQQAFAGHGSFLVLNSGLTFREAHDKTNSLQNPKLPDWAILDITQPPNAESAGKVVAADFFDEHWQVKHNMPPVDSKEVAGK